MAIGIEDHDYKEKERAVVEILMTEEELEAYAYKYSSTVSEDPEEVEKKRSFYEALEKVNLWDLAKKHLTPKQYEILELRCINLLTECEIAECLSRRKDNPRKVNQSTVSLSLSASGKKLRKALAKLNIPEITEKLGVNR